MSAGLLEWREVKNVEHLGPIWGPMLFNVFIDLEECVDSMLVKAVEGAKVFHLVNNTESCGECRKDFPWS